MSEIKSITGLPISTTHELSADGANWVMKDLYAVPYKASLKLQLEQWVVGKPEHNHFSDECCPDFSCCQPDALWPEEKRKQFVVAHRDTRISMMFSGLACTFLPETKVYITGHTHNTETIH